MIFKIKWSYLEALVNKASTVGGEITSPILDSFLFELQGDLLKVFRTNKVLSVVATTEHFDLEDETEPHRFVIDGKDFYDLVKSLKERKTVTFETLKDNFIGIRAGKFKGSWNGQNPEDYPKLPKPMKGSKLITVNAIQFFKALEKIKYAAMRDGLRLEFRQAYFDGVNCWASDDARYQKALTDCGGTKFKMVLPVEGFDVAAFLKLSNAEKVSIGETADYYFFIIKDDMFLCKKSNVEAVCPEILLQNLDAETQGYFYFDVALLSDIVARIGLTAPHGSRRIQFEIQKDKLVVKSKNRTQSESEESIVISLQGHQDVTKKFGLDWEFLSEALKVINEKSAVMWVDKEHIVLDDGKGGIGVVPMKKGKYGS